MTATSINLGARKAVLIMEAEDGSALVATIYDPRIDRDFPEYDFHTTRLTTEGTNRLTFVSGKAFATSRSNEDLRKKAVDVYDEGARVFSGTETIPVMASEDEIRKWMQDRHEDALHAVFLAGVFQGAEQVKFHDERIEKEIAEAPLRGIEGVQRELRMLTATKSGKPVQKGLRRALKLAEKVRTTFVQGLSK